LVTQHDAHHKEKDASVPACRSFELLAPVASLWLPLDGRFTAPSALPGAAVAATTLALEALGCTPFAVDALAATPVNSGIEACCTRRPHSCPCRRRGPATLSIAAMKTSVNRQVMQHVEKNTVPN
jgi:hypothetical protein